MKTCSKCGTEKSLEDFTRDRRKADGRSSRCKVCHNAMTTAWREENPSYLRDYYLARRPELTRVIAVVVDGAKACTTCGATKPLEDFHRLRTGVGGRHGSCKACRAEAHRANPEQGRVRAQRQRETQPDYMALWRASNRARVAEYDLRRRRRLQDCEFSTEYMAALCAEIRTQPCVYCGGPGGEVDHIAPLARGGPHHPQNLAPACRSCNSSKGDRPLGQWDGPPSLRIAA